MLTILTHIVLFHTITIIYLLLFKKSLFTLQYYIMYCILLFWK